MNEEYFDFETMEKKVKRKISDRLYPFDLDDTMSEFSLK